MKYKFQVNVHTLSYLTYTVANIFTLTITPSTTTTITTVTNAIRSAGWMVQGYQGVVPLFEWFSIKLNDPEQRFREVCIRRVSKKVTDPHFSLPILVLWTPFAEYWLRLLKIRCKPVPEVKVQSQTTPLSHSPVIYHLSSLLGETYEVVIG